MGDFDPFSGIPLSPPSISPDDITLDDALCIVVRLMEADLSRLSDDEIRSLVSSQISAFFDGIGHFISTLFISAISTLISNTKEEIKRLSFIEISQLLLWIAPGILFILITDKINKRKPSITKKSLSKEPPATARHVVSVPAQDKVLQPRELEELFSTAPESLLIENPYKDAVERNEFGGLSRDAFLSEASKDIGVESPMPISVKLGAVNNIFRRIVTAAEHLHLSISKIEVVKIRKQYPRLTNPSHMLTVGLGIVVTVKMAAACKNASS